MLVDWNEGYISVCPTPEYTPIVDNTLYIPISTWGFIKGDISEQGDLMNLLTTIESGLTPDQIALLVNADERMYELEQDIIDLTAQHNTEITDITTALTTKANTSDVYTKEEIDSKGYLTEHQSLVGYATENWVYTRGYISAETDPIWSAEKHKYALKSEIPTVAGLATQSWVNEQLTAKANLTDVYSKNEIDGKKYITENQLNTELLAKANTTDVYSKIEIDGKNFATQNWTTEKLLGKANTTDVYSKAEIDSKEYIGGEQLNERLLGKANATDVYTKVEIDGKNFATQNWTTEKLLTKANTSDVWTKAEMAGGMLGADDLKLTGYATESWVVKQGYLTEHQSLDNYYTKDEVDTAIENVEVDLTGYATEDWVKEQNYLTEHQSLDNYYTKSEVDTAIENVDVDLTGYATESYVDAAVETKVDNSQIWTGTQDEWDALSVEQQNSYTIAMIEI